MSQERAKIAKMSDSFSFALKSAAFRKISYGYVREHESSPRKIWISYGTAWIRNSGIKQEYPTYNTRFHRLLLSNSFVEYKNEDNALFFIAVVSW